MKNPDNNQTIVILNNIRSNENVGSIFRTCDAAGVSKIILCGFTPAPIDRFGRANLKLAKTSLGAEKFVAWEKSENLKCVINKLRREKIKWKIVGVEQDKKAINYKQLNQKSKFANYVLIFGNEVKGLSKSDLGLCDIITEIPMRGKKESLNVAVCVGIMLFELLR